MGSSQGWRFLGSCILFLRLITPAFAEAENTLCGGPQALLSLIDRPTVGFSPCTVPEKKVILEQGFQAQKLLISGSEQNFPAAEVRFGLPSNNEFFVLLPNYYRQSVTPHAGLSATTIGLKHELNYTDTWLFTAMALVTPPSGSTSFGERGLGGSLSGIFTYTILDSLSFTGQFGVSTQTLSVYYGGQRFTSFDQDVYLSWVIKNKILIYGEIYGRSKTGPKQGSGYNTDIGIIILLRPNLTIDVEAGQRLRGQLGFLENYVGVGMVIQN